jgi:Conserved protein containing a Zn-ribbon-like motif, possibly RNA-binding
MPVNSELLVKEALKGLPSILALPLVTDIPCLNFVNSAYWRLLPGKSHDTFDSYASLLAFSLRLDLLSVECYSQLSERANAARASAERAFREALAFRAALTSILDSLTARQPDQSIATIDPQALAIFDAARKRAHEFESLTWSAEHFSLKPNPEDEGLDLPWLILVRDAERLLCSEDAAYIRVCSAKGCGRIFLDQSKNGTRRWCSMQLCGNREKAARYKAKA